MALFKKRNKPVKEVRDISDIKFETFASTIFGSKSTNAIATKCENLIANAIGTLSIDLYFKTNQGGRVKAYNNPLYNLMKYEPNSENVPFTFYSTIVRHLLQEGNSYIYKDMKGEEIIALYILSPKQMEVKRDEINRKVFTYAGKVQNPKHILHIVGLGFDGLKGKSVLDNAREQLELSNKLDEFAIDSFDNGITKRPVVDISEMYQTASPDDVRKIGEYLKNNYADNNKPFITFNGMKLNTLDTSDTRTQSLLDNRKFQKEFIADLYNVPMSMLNQQGNVNLEVSNTLFLQYTLLPWIKILEQHFKLLLTPYERERHYFEFNISSFLRADTATRFQSYSTGLMNGFLSHNDIAKLENREVLETEAGKTYFVPANLMPLTDEVIQSYMATAKLKMKELGDKDTTGIGDDKK